MGQYLCIAATFLTNRYHGREWPPNPARLFQALLAGVCTGSYSRYWTTVEPALRLLETLPAPEMLAREGRTSCSYQIAVPNNDSDKAGREWSAGRSFDLGRIRTMKTVAAREFADGAPHVYYMWKLPEPQPEVGVVLQLTSLLHTFGWGIDMAYANSFVIDEGGKQSLISTSCHSHHVPGERGRPCPVPAPGYLDDLVATYDRYCRRLTKKGVDPSIRATKYAQQRYADFGSITCPRACFLLRQLNDSDKAYVVPWAFGMKAAAWMRHATAGALREEGYTEEFVNSYVLGHNNGHKSHMSFVPVPTIRTLHADGAIRRVMLVEPPAADGSITALLQRKLAPSDIFGLNNGGAPRAICSLVEAPMTDPVFPRYFDTKPLWHSVTPVVLHGHNSERGKFSLKKTEQLLYQSLTGDSDLDG